MTGMASRLLESVLLNMSIQYGGYDKIPVPKINDAVRVVVVTVIIAEAVRLVGIE